MQKNTFGWRCSRREGERKCAQNPLGINRFPEKGQRGLQEGMPMDQAEMARFASSLGQKHFSLAGEKLERTH